MSGAVVGLDSRLAPVIGDKSAAPIEKAFGYRTVGELLRHFPRSYVSFDTPSSFSELVPGQYVSFVAEIIDIKGRRARNNRRLLVHEVTLSDGEAFLTATFFNQYQFEKSNRIGRTMLFAGQVELYNGQLQLTQPRVDDIDLDAAQARSIVPIYPATKAVPTWGLDKAIAHLLLVLDDDLGDLLPASLGLPALRESFEKIHRPETIVDYQQARYRFRFEEAFVIQTYFARRRAARDAETAVARRQVSDGLAARLREKLPFTLTDGQLGAVADISTDLEQTHPMHRLLQGEVGSGKTLVALLAMLQVVDARAQAVLLAPTEVLATQHHRGISSMLGSLGADVHVRLLTGSLGAKERQSTLLDLISGRANIIIGTHALLTDTVEFFDLGLVVVDEQHRFGVEQRAALIERAGDHVPHLLVMTATPIPRTVAMTVFGDLETTTLTELPAGRQPIQTTLVPAAEKPTWVDRAWQRIVEEVGKGRQAYVVASRIGDTETDSESATTSVVDLFDELSGGPLSGLKVGLLHGRLSTDEKDATMSAFAAGDIDVLVATTVIEVGVDVPNATVMVIVDADRFGVSQLHQLRGRVGRGSEPGLCLLVTSMGRGTPARERLDAVAATNDGFELARFDAEQRREGDVLGSRQSGVGSSLRLLSVVRDADVIDKARVAATELVRSDPDLSGHPGLAAAIKSLEDSEKSDYLERA